MFVHSMNRWKGVTVNIGTLEKREGEYVCTLMYMHTAHYPSPTPAPSNALESAVRP